MRWRRAAFRRTEANGAAGSIRYFFFYRVPLASARRADHNHDAMPTVCSTCSDTMYEDEDSSSRCAQCDEPTCDECLSEEGEDGFLCIECVRVCETCHAPIVAADSEHHEPCARCGKGCCSGPRGRIEVCCDKVCAPRTPMEDSACELAARAALIDGPCCYHCVRHVQHLPCAACAKVPCEQHLVEARAGCGHVLCQDCTEVCERCNQAPIPATRCFACAPHTPLECRMACCRECRRLRALCPRCHAKHCPECLGAHDGVGFCAPCRDRADGALALVGAHLPPPLALGPVAAYLGARAAHHVANIPGTSWEPSVSDWCEVLAGPPFDLDLSVLRSRKVRFDATSTGEVLSALLHSPRWKLGLARTALRVSNGRRSSGEAAPLSFNKWRAVLKRVLRVPRSLRMEQRKRKRGEEL